MDRRVFLRRALVAAAGGAVATHLPSLAAVAQTAVPGVGPFGALRTEPDQHGLLLPEGFTSRVIGVAGEQVGSTGYTWLPYPDGAATFPTEDGGWIYTVNSEVFTSMAPASGGASAIRFGPDGDIVDAYRILEGSHSNCSGGATPWGTWLSCEEAVYAENGLVWECDPTGERRAIAHPAMGRWTREAVAVDPVDEIVYQTQDHPEGLLYRFVPDAYPDLSSGRLEACVVAEDHSVTWVPVPDPSGTSAPTRAQVPGATRFDRGEGIWYHDGWIYFCTTGDHSVHGIDLRSQTHTVLWNVAPDRVGVEAATLSHVDGITVATGTGDLFVAEDGGNMEVVMITPEGVVAPFVRIPDSRHETSEITGPCFSPNGLRLYFSSQRGPTPRAVGEMIGTDLDERAGGITYEISGPFRRAGGANTSASSNRSPVATLAAAGAAVGNRLGPGPTVGVGLGLGMAAAAAASLMARRTRGPAATDELAETDSHPS